MNRQSFFKSLFFAAALSASVLTGCGQKHSYTETEIVNFADSSDLVIFSMQVELPVVFDEVSDKIRKDLLSIVKEDFDGMAYDEQAIYEMDVEDSLSSESFVTRFGEATFSSLNRLAQDDSDMREIEIQEDEDFEMHDFQWECIYNLNRVLDEDRYCVFYSEMYQYLGGMHGGISGSGYITYSKADGRRVTGILDPDAVMDMQDLLVQGIARYFAESGEEIPEDQVINYLFIEDGIIPLPKNEPYLSEDGLTLIYQQYEIAPYVIGMPQFTIPYDEVRPFMTEEARKLLGM